MKLHTVAHGELNEQGGLTPAGIADAELVAGTAGQLAFAEVFCALVPGSSQAADIITSRHRGIRVSEASVLSDPDGLTLEQVSSATIDGESVADGQLRRLCTRLGSWALNLADRHNAVNTNALIVAPEIPLKALATLATSYRRPEPDLDFPPREFGRMAADHTRFGSRRVITFNMGGSTYKVMSENINRASAH